MLSGGGGENEGNFYKEYWRKVTHHESNNLRQGGELDENNGPKRIASMYIDYDFVYGFV